MVPLSFVESGSLVKIIDFRCGGKCSCRLRELGIMKGGWYRVSAGANGSPFIISDGESRIGLGVGMAVKVMVQEVSHG